MSSPLSHRRDDRLVAAAWPARRGMVLTVAFAALWAALEIALGSNLRQPYDLMQVVWWRYATHLALMLVLFSWRGPARLWRTRRPLLQLGRSLLMLVMPVSYAMSLAHGIDADLVWAEFWIAPLLLLLLARALLGERAPAVLWVCCALIPCAALFMRTPHPPRSIGAIMLPLLMSLSFCIYVVATRALRHEPLSANLFYTALAVFAVLTPRMPLVWHTPPLHDAIVLTGIGAVGLLVLALLDRAVERCGVSIVAPVMGLQLPFAAVLTELYHGVAVSRNDLVATLLLAVMFAWLWRCAGDLRVEAIGSGAESAGSLAR